MLISTSIGQLTTALVEAKKIITNPKKGNQNPFFKSRYADLGSVLDACNNGLQANGLVVSQIVTVEPHTGKDALLTMLMHVSGEYIGGYYILNPAKPDPQGVGSAVTYARRYALQALLGMAAEDDDGNAASVSVPGFVPKAKAPTVAEQQAAQGAKK